MFRTFEWDLNGIKQENENDVGGEDVADEEEGLISTKYLQII